LSLNRHCRTTALQGAYEATVRASLLTPTATTRDGDSDDEEDEVDLSLPYELPEHATELDCASRIVLLEPHIPPSNSASRVVTLEQILQ